MVQYNCDRCGKDFKQKCHFHNHLKRKNICKPIQSDTTIQFMKEKYEFIKKSPHNSTQLSTQLHTTPHNSTQNQNKCKYCDEIFSRSDSLARHMQKYCNKSKNLMKENEELKKKIEKLECDKTHIVNSNNTNSNNTNNTTNNITNNNTNNTINITLNDYGDEDVSHITMDFIQNLIEHMNSNSIVKMIDAVHFQNPGNVNIKIPNKKQPFMMVWKEDKWVLENKSNILDGLVVKNFDRINDVYEEFENDLSENIKTKYTSYADMFDNNDGKHRNNVKKETELMLLNKKKNDESEKVINEIS